MSRSIVVLMVATALCCPVGAQILTCSEAGSGDCHYVHYHVQSWDDSARGMREFFGTNRFATLQACESERSRRMIADKQAVGYVLKQAPRARVRESNFGPCHCDMTSDPSNRYYLNDEARFKQMHLQRNVALQLLEEAYDKGLSPESPIAEGLAPRPTSFVASHWPDVAEIPPDSPDRFLSATPPEARSSEVSTVPAVTLDVTRYDLVEIGFGDQVPLETIYVDDTADRTDPAARFVNREIAAVQEHLSSVLEMDESPDKERIFELIQQRMQLLSNLGRLVQTAGQSSALARAISSTEGDPDRLILVGKIFGETVKGHWMAPEPEGLLIDIPESIATDPVAVLRDAGRRFSKEEKQLALYVYLMKSAALTANQEVWLSGIIESWLVN